MWAPENCFKCSASLLCETGTRLSYRRCHRCNRVVSLFLDNYSAYASYGADYQCTAADEHIENVRDCIDRGQYTPADEVFVSTCTLCSMTIV
jgi:hypothetical protein